MFGDTNPVIHPHPEHNALRCARGQHPGAAGPEPQRSWLCWAVEAGQGLSSGRPPVPWALCSPCEARSRRRKRRSVPALPSPPLFTTLPPGCRRLLQERGHGGVRSSVGMHRLRALHLLHLLHLPLSTVSTGAVAVKLQRRNS